MAPRMSKQRAKMVAARSRLLKNLRKLPNRVDFERHSREEAHVSAFSRTPRRSKTPTTSLVMSDEALLDRSGRTSIGNQRLLACDRLVGREQRQRQFSPKATVWGSIGADFRSIRIWPRCEPSSKRMEAVNRLFRAPAGGRSVIAFRPSLSTPRELGSWMFQSGAPEQKALAFQSKGRRANFFF